MQLDTRKIKGVVVITVTGTITMMEAPRRLKERVASLVEEGEKQIVLSLGQLTFVDSSCIGEIVSCSLTVARAGGMLKLANPARRIQELLLVTRLGDIFETYETDSAAVASFAVADD
jgi:anti-sigma B factor antagonist